MAISMTSTDMVQRNLDHIMKIKTELFHAPHHTYLVLAFDYKGFETYIPYTSLYSSREAPVRTIVETALCFEEQMLWMRDGNGPVWG